MKDHLILWLIAIAGILLLGSSSLYKSLPLSEPTAPKKEIKNPHFQDFADNFDQYFQTQQTNTYTPGAAVVIVKDTSVYLMKGYGLKRNSSRNIDSIDVNTLFRIGSLSKGFASILAGTYVEDDLIEWDDKVQDYIPEFELNNANRGSDVSIEHLLSQTSGVSYHAYTSAIESGWSLDKITPRFKTVKLTGSPGEVYSYQNAVYSLVGKIFEQKSKIPLDSIYQERLFNPLGMKDASVTYKGMKNAKNRATPHLFRRYWKPTSITKKYYNAIPAGGVNASIADMTQWLQLILGNREDVIKKETLDKIFSSHINTHNRRKYFSKWRGVKESHYGLGWRVVKRTNDTFIYHGGYVNGFKSEILMNREDKVAICVLTNAPSQLSSIAIPTFINKYDHYRELIMSWNPNEEPVL
jgi:beta-lactamase class C